MNNTNRDIFVVVENADTGIRSSSLELFTAAKLVTDKTGGKIIAVMLGHDLAAATEEVAVYGPDMIIRVDDERLKEYKTAAYTNAITALVKKYNPDAVMISASKNGKDMAPRIARRLGTGITANCTELKVEAETGLISWNMPAPGGIMATILCTETRPQMGTICPGAFRKNQTEKKANLQIIDENLEEFEEDALTLISRVVKEADTELSITTADIIVAGGRGMGSKENFEKIRELASLLGAAVGASRAIVDLEWAEQKNLVGQTGKIVAPKLYLAFGISGALQHMIGVEKAECIVAVNTDETAPIFGYADYAIVGDANKIAAALIEQIKAGENK